MIMRKTWFKYKYKRPNKYNVPIYMYTGYFLFGFIPLYVDRKSLK